MPEAYNYWMLQRARRVKPGTCLICGIDYKAKTWMPDSSARICDAHNAVETRRALAALDAADRERNAAHG